MLFRKDSRKGSAANDALPVRQSPQRQSVSDVAPQTTTTTTIDNVTVSSIIEAQLTHSKSSPPDAWKKRNSNPDVSIAANAATANNSNNSNVKQSQSPTQRQQQRKSVVLTHSREYLLEHNKRLSVNLDRNVTKILFLFVIKHSIFSFFLKVANWRHAIEQRIDATDLSISVFLMSILYSYITYFVLVVVHHRLTCQLIQGFKNCFVCVVEK